MGLRNENDSLDEIIGESGITDSQCQQLRHEHSQTGSDEVHDPLKSYVALYSFITAPYYVSLIYYIMNSYNISVPTIGTAPRGSVVELQVLMN